MGHLTRGSWRNMKILSFKNVYRNWNNSINIWIKIFHVYKPLWMYHSVPLVTWHMQSEEDNPVLPKHREMKTDQQLPRGSSFKFPRACMGDESRDSSGVTASPCCPVLQTLKVRLQADFQTPLWVREYSVLGPQQKHLLLSSILSPIQQGSTALLSFHHHAAAYLP